jgi:hypothetical protein
VDSCVWPLSPSFHPNPDPTWHPPDRAQPSIHVHYLPHTTHLLTRYSLGREADDLIGRGYVEVAGAVAARLLRGERVALPVALSDLTRDAAATVAGAGAMRVRAPRPGGGDGGILGATAALLSQRSSTVPGGVYGRSDLEALVELLLLDCAASGLVPVSLLASGAARAGGAIGPVAAARPGVEGGAHSAGALARAPSLSARDGGDCVLLVLVSAAEGMPLVKR